MTGTDLAALPRQLARTRRFSLGHPTRAVVSPDGRTVFFLRSRAGMTRSAACGRWTG
jgi:dipeptidyl-peptidase-4